ncbi:MAG: potassium-transporting ATPase subunit C [Jatrophihabitans sp.]|uniref:potassium-transporting ATPase subunit C n=1 Tax=Jatrophihabitans sp. TaxID=1932789 RepID=UPI003F7E541A
MNVVITWLRTTFASLRLLLVLTVVLGIAYPLVVTAVAQVPGLQHKADGSLVRRDGRVVGSSLLGQSFTDAKGDPLPQYFQPRPSAAGAGYDPTASGASNLGPESIVDTLPDPSVKDDTGKQSLLTQVCSRSLAIGRFDGVDGRRPYCTSTGVGAVLAVFWSGPGYQGHVVRAVSVNQACPATPFLATYRGVRVECARFGADYSRGQIVPVRGSAPGAPAVPADAVTASASGLDPDISPAYARIQEARVAKARGVTVAQVAALVSRYTDGRGLGFMGESTVAVLPLNVALDRSFPVPSR